MSVQRMDVRSNGQETGRQFGYRVRPYYVKLVSPTFLTKHIDFTSLVMHIQILVLAFSCVHVYFFVQLIG